MSETLKMETTAVNSLKRQLLEFSEIAERHKATLRDAQADPALVEVLDRTAHLLAGQTNPTGEQYSLQKVGRGTLVGFSHWQGSGLSAAFLLGSREPGC
jgi:hypothetical protein